ncbi:MAG: hypothetical protein ACREEW_18845 [Caulobacteraceae bacterium]
MRGRSPNTWLWAMVAVAAFAWAMIGVVFASLGPAALVPHVFHNLHAEHFCAFYALAILAAAGLPRARLWLIVLALCAVAAALALVRLTMPVHRLPAAEDFLADVAGALAAVVPMLVGRFRAQASPPTTGREPA